MFKSFSLVTIVKQGRDSKILRIQLEQELQKNLSKDWKIQYETFKNLSEEPFNPGYSPTPDQNICFSLQEHDLPKWLHVKNSFALVSLEDISDYHSIVGIAAYVRCSDEIDRILFQNFNKGKLIKPGRILFMKKNIYQSLDNDGLWLDSKLTAVYEFQSKKLLFKNFVTTNKIIDLSAVYRDATEQDVRDILSHDLFYSDNVDAIIQSTKSQWYRKRFAMLKDSKVLNDYSANTIRESGVRIGIAVKLKDDRIVFPENQSESKRLLQLLSEEIYRGVITNNKYETNSKKSIND